MATREENESTRAEGAREKTSLILQGAFHSRLSADCCLINYLKSCSETFINAQIPETERKEIKVERKISAESEVCVNVT